MNSRNYSNKSKSNKLLKNKSKGKNKIKNWPMSFK